MAPNERAQNNHDELFPSHVSTLAVTDPELIEVFDNFAFDEVLSHGSLDARTRLMVQLASMIASQALCEYRVMIKPALIVGVTPVEIKEIVYQAVPYVGIAKVFDFLLAANEVLKENGVFGDSGRGLRLERNENTIFLSPILKWNAGDFNGATTATGQFLSYARAAVSGNNVLDFVLGYVSQDVATYIHQKRPTVKYLDYNWTLNSQKLHSHGQ